MIWNISFSGALVERASVIVPIDVHVGLSPSYYPGSNEVELWGEVVRMTESGFGVEFTTLGESGLALLRRILP